MSTFKMIPLEAIQHSPYNPRRQPTADDPKVKELAASIKAVGLIQPISLRESGMNGKVKGHQMYQIIAGARRFEAAKLAGLDEIAAMVHKMSVDDALKITVTENLQREDLTPLEEGRGIASLLEAGRSTDEIAADIAKSQTWVRRRAKLADLIKEWQDAVTDGEYQYFSAAHLEIVAHLSPSIQKKMLGSLKSMRKDDGKITLTTLRYKIRYYTHYLREAAFDITGCESCDNRSDREPDLFAACEYEHEQADKGKDKARCLDCECWKVKLEAFLDEGRKKIIQKTGKEPILINDGYGKVPKGSVPAWQAKSANPKDKGAVPAMAMNGDKAGKLTWIIPPAQKPSGNQESAKPKDATVKQMRIMHMINAFNDWLGKQKKCPSGLLKSPYHMLGLVFVYGSEMYGQEESTPKSFDDLISPKKSVELCDQLWRSAINGIRIYCHDPLGISERQETELDLALHVCGLEKQDFLDDAAKSYPDHWKPETKTPAKKGGKKS